MGFFMINSETGNHHTGPDEGLWIHYHDTCNTRSVYGWPSLQGPFGSRLTAIETRLAPSRKGLVGICYETKGLITFYAQISPKRVAWQRIDWDKGFHEKWDTTKIKKAIENFLWVAECEEARKLLPKP